MTPMRSSSRGYGFSLIEFMVAIAAGLILLAGIVAIFSAQTRTYATSGAQGAIQDEENAISALVTPVLRGTGFMGCAGSAAMASLLVPGGAPPLGAATSPFAPIMGYGYASTGPATTYVLGSLPGAASPSPQDNVANDAGTGDWSPTLDISLKGLVEPGSDVISVVGGVPQTQPVGVTAVAADGSNFTIYDNPDGIAAGQFGAISDCGKSVVFQITSAGGASTGANWTLSYATGGNPFDNVSNTLPAIFQPGAQFVPLQQTAFFVAQNPGSGGESVLMRAILQAGGNWVVQPLVPGVEMMQVLYGVGAGGVPTQYLTAAAVNAGNAWSMVDTVRVAFLLEGEPGSASNNNPTSITMLGGMTVQVPHDTRLRHLFEITVNLRNAV